MLEDEAAWEAPDWFRTVPSWFNTERKFELAVDSASLVLDVSEVVESGMLAEKLSPDPFEPDSRSCWRRRVATDT